MMNTVLYCVLLAMVTTAEVYGQEQGTSSQTGTVQIHFEMMGGFEGGHYKASINSKDLPPEEARKLRSLVKDTGFFDLPSEISSSNGRCHDCHHYRVTIETPLRKHSVYIDTRFTEIPPAFVPLFSWIKLQACQTLEFGRKCPRVSREKAQEIATQYADNMKFNIESKDISIEWYDTPWNRWIRRDSTSEYDAPRLKKLSAHQYYAVEFTPHDRMTKGGQTVIFVDSHTGEVITFAAYK